MSQITINIGSLPNDGKGDPIRTAFDVVNKNFANVFGTGLVGSNLLIQNNSIISTNVNGEIRLVPNGVGNVVSNAHIIPNATNVRNLGSTGRRWRSVYAQYFDTVNQNVWGNLVVTGNLTTIGNVVTANVATLDVANLTITLAAGATSPGVADGAGILIDGAGANMTYSAATDTLDFNVGLGVSGFVQALGFIGDGGGLSNIQVDINSAALVGNTIANNIQFSSLTTVGTLANLLVTGNVQTAGVFIGNGSGLTNITANSVTGTVGNAYYANLAQNAFNANNASHAVFATTASQALSATKATYANTAGLAANAVYANTAFMACTADIANVATLASNAIYSNSSVYSGIVTGNAQPNITSLGTLTSLSVTGNIVTVSGIYTDNYFYANGAPFTGSGNGGGGNYGNSNVASFLESYSGNMGAISVTAISSNDYLWANGQPFVGNYSDANVIALMASGNVPYVVTANINTSALTVTGYSSLTRLGVTGNATIGNLFTDNYFYANGTPVTFGGNGSGAVIGDQQFVGNGSTTYPLNIVSTANSMIVTTNGLTQAPGIAYSVVGNNIVFTSSPVSTDLIDIRFLGTSNGGGTGNYGDSNVVSLLSSASVGNIIPAGNAIYYLGNSTNQWKSLYVSGNTIYLNNLPLSVVASNKLNWNGDNLVVSSGTNGNIITAGNVVGNYYFGNARFMSGLPATYTDANVAVYLASGTDSGNIITTGNVRGTYVLGNGAFLTGTYSNASVANYLPAYTGAMTAMLGNVITQANISGQYILGNARYLTGLPATYGNANVQAYLPTYTGNLPLLTGVVQTTGNVNANYFNGNGRYLTGLPTSYTDANVSTYLASGADTANIITTGNISGTYYIGNGRLLTGMNTFGNANVQAYLPTYTGNLSPNVVTANLVTAGNVTGTTVRGGNITLQSNTITSSVGPLTLNNDVVITGNLEIMGNSTIIDSNVVTINDKVFVVANNSSTGATASGAGIQVSDSNFASMLYNYPANAWSFSIPIIADGHYLTSITGANVTGTVANATYALTANNSVFSGTVTTNAQPNITSVGTLANLTVTGNIDSSANITGVYIIGNGTHLTGITGANVLGTVANANYSLFSNSAVFSGTVTTNAQPNITSVGVLTSLSATGNIDTTANISGTYFLGNGRFLTGMYGNADVAAYLPTYTGNISAGNIAVTANISSGNISVISNVDVGDTLTTVQLIADDVVASNVFTGNISTDNYYYANGSPVVFGSGGILGDQQFVGNGTATYPLDIITTDNTVIVSVNGLTQVPGVAYAVAGNVITFTGAISATDYVDVRFVSNSTIYGSLTYNDSNVAAYLPSYTGAMTAMLGNVTTTANISGSYILGNGAFLTGLPAPYANSNAISLLENLTSNIVSTANITGSYIIGNGSLLSNLTGANVLGTVANANYSLFANSSVYSTYATNANVANIVYDNAQPNITSVGVLTSLSVLGNVTSAYFIGNGATLSSITGANVVGAVANATYALNANNSTYAGTVTANAQPNITSVGTLTSLSVSGNTTSNYFIGNGSLLTGVVSNYGNANVESLLASGTVTSNIRTSGNVTSNYLFGNGVNITGIVSSYGNANVSAYLAAGTDTANIVTTGNVRGGNVSATGTVTAPNLASKATGFVTDGTAVTLNNLSAVVPVAGNKSILVSTVSGTLALVGSEQAVVAGVGATSAISAAVTTTPAYLNVSRTMTAPGDLQVCNVVDIVANAAYRITLVIGPSTTNQITIEQL